MRHFWKSSATILILGIAAICQGKPPDAEGSDGAAATNPTNLAPAGEPAVSPAVTDSSDEQYVMAINGYRIDTRDPERTCSQLPSTLRRSELANALRQGRSPAGGLYLVKLSVPVSNEVLTALRATGVELVSYVHYDAYVVQASATAAAALVASRLPQVRYVGDYEPGFRLSPELRHGARDVLGSRLMLTVQVVDGPTAQATIDALKEMAVEFQGETQVLNLHNVRLTVNASQLDAVASLMDVFHIERRQTERQFQDEAAAQIAAGNVSASGIANPPGYLSWLASKGFNSTQFDSFVVEVVDDTYTLSGHPDMQAGRVAFEFDPTQQKQTSLLLGGHGFLDALIIGGFNNGTGAAVEDSRGHNYGLGIAPWARMGATAVAGPNPSNLTSKFWENVAYEKNARISSNSWTFNTIKSYDTTAQEFDSLVRDARSGIAGNQQMIMVVAAGNYGSAPNTVATPGTAKNAITVGASENDRQTGTDGLGYDNTYADNANDIFSKSSRGPVNAVGGDGRWKPDLVAPGTHIQAGVPQSNYSDGVVGLKLPNKYWPAGQTLYSWASGTSQACAAVAGAAALVYQDFLNKGRPAPSPAMTKAILMNSTTYMTGIGANDTLPSNNQGMGRINLGRAFDSVPRILVDQTRVFSANGEVHQVTGSISTSTQPFRVTLAWTDAPGSSTSMPWMNDLNLEVTVNGTLYRGNVFSGASSITGGTADGKNNVESVFLPAGTSGNFTVAVKASNLKGDGVPGNVNLIDQDFALVIYNGVQSTIGVSPSSFTFNATAGAASPAAQTLSISNTGGGALAWSASSNASWLSVNSASGTAPSSVIISATNGGLPPGSYSGAVTIASTGASNSPKTVPVTMNIAAANMNLLVNGGFEDPTLGWTFNNAYWTNGAFPHTGTGYSFLGQANGTVGSEFQQVTIPTWASGKLTFWLNITTYETTTTTQYDKLFVEVRDTLGNLLKELATFSNLDAAAAGVYSQKTFDIPEFRGQTVRIQFRGITDGGKASTFRIDDVSLM